MKLNFQNQLLNLDQPPVPFVNLPSNSCMTFMLSNKGHIKLSNSVIEQIRSYEQHKKSDLEAGGVLLGRFVIESKDIVVDTVSVPMRGDERTRYSFHRGAK